MQKKPNRQPDRLLTLLLAVAGSILICTSAGAADNDDLGPLPFQNRFPLHFMFLTPRPAAPVIPHSGQWRTTAVLEYSSINFDHRNVSWDFLMDMELTTLNLSFSMGLGDRVGIGLELPLVTLQDGFLDGFLETYHDTLNVPNYGRENRPKDTFGYTVRHNGKVWVDGRTTGWALADSTVSLAVALPRPSSASIFRSTLEARIKVPVGNPDLGLGSGRWDAGIYWSTGWRFRRWSLYLMPGYAWISDPDTRGADVHTRNSISVFVAAGYQFNQRWRWTAQLNGYTSMVEATGLSELDNGSVQLDLGFQYRIGPGWHLICSFAEDLTLAAPDFTLRAGMAWTP